MKKWVLPLFIILFLVLRTGLYATIGIPVVIVLFILGKSVNKGSDFKLLSDYIKSTGGRTDRYYGLDVISGNPLSSAACYGSVILGRILLSQGIKADGDDYGSTLPPLLLATTYGHQDFVKLLIKNGALVNKPAVGNKLTPLHISCYRRDVESVKTLLDYGGDVNSCDMKKRTPLHILCTKPKGLQSESVEIEILLLLLEKNASINSADEYGLTPLHLAAGNMLSHSFISTMIEHGSNVNAVTFSGCLPKDLVPKVTTLYIYLDSRRMMLWNKGNITRCGFLKNK